MCEEGRSCLNVIKHNSTVSLGMPGPKPSSPDSSHYCSLWWLQVSPLWKRAAIFSCHSLKDMGQNLSFNHHLSPALSSNHLSTPCHFPHCLNAMFTRITAPSSPSQLFLNMLDSDPSSAPFQQHRRLILSYGKIKEQSVPVLDVDLHMTAWIMTHGEKQPLRW